MPLDEQRLFLLLGDASGHGIGPALSATQMTGMLRVALRLGADLDAIFAQVNNQLVEDLPEEHFVTAFFGVLDTARTRSTTTPRARARCCISRRRPARAAGCRRRRFRSDS